MSLAGNGAPADRPILVVGGGIGGLATALALAERNYPVEVLERNDRFAELGAGIQIAPNGLVALDRLGVGDAVRRIGVHVDELRFLDGVSGEQVTSLPLTGAYVDRFGDPYLVVHRGELHRSLLEACRRSTRIRLCSGVPITGYRQSPGGVTATTRDGATLAGRALIGADGLWSVIRACLLGDGPPQSVGITVYRCTVPMERVPEPWRVNSVVWWAGPGRHFVHYPIAGGRYLNLAPSVETGAASPAPGVPMTAGAVRRELAALDDAAHALLALGTDWRSWTLLDRDPVPIWHDRRVLLTGDAAHPMLHYLAQGACQALEDAVALGSSLDGCAGDLAAAFEDFCLRRRERTAAMQRAARHSIRLWHAAGPAAAARDAALRGLSIEQLLDKVAWLHGDRQFTDRSVSRGRSASLAR